MIAAPPKYPVPAWSFSVLKDFESCPFRVFLAKVEKAPEPEYVAPEPNAEHPLERGNRVHKEAENAVKGEGPITKDLKKFAGRVEELNEAYEEGRVMVEQEWGFDENWSITDWRDWANIWLRVKCDVVEQIEPQVLHIDDWKTGKSMGNEVKHREQLQLYAISGFMRLPEVNIISGAMLYLDEGPKKTLVQTFTRDKCATMLHRWTLRAQRLTKALAFPPKPNRHNCRFCPFGISNGTGFCQYAVGE